MQRKKTDNIEWLEFDLLHDIEELFHAVLLKNDASQEENLKKIADTYNISPQATVKAHQVHGDAIVKVDASTALDALTCDALSTNNKEYGLTIKHADCQATIIYDPINHAVASVHSGWRGSVKNIYKGTINHLRENYGSKPENLLMCVGPSLGPENAEFINYKTELPKSFWEFQTKPNHFDFWAITEMQAKECGILPHHLEIACIDTFDNPKDFYSYRRDKTENRHYTTVKLV